MGFAEFYKNLTYTVDDHTSKIPPDANLYSRPNAEETTRAIEAMQHTFSKQICFDTNIGDDTCISILEALLRNPNVGQVIDNGKIKYTCVEALKFLSAGLTDACGDALINYITRNQKTAILAIGGNKFSEEMLMKLLQAFPKRGRFIIVVENETYFTPDFLKELAAYQLANPGILYTPYVESLGSVHFNSELSRYQIENKALIQKIKILHLQILSGVFRGVDTSKEVNELTTLSTAEETRLGKLTIDILKSYTLKGGHEYISRLSLDTRVEQFIPAPAVKEYHNNPAAVIKLLLGQAGVMEHRFRSLIAEVSSALNSATDMNSFTGKFEPSVKQGIMEASKSEESFEILVGDDAAANDAAGVYVSCGEYRDSPLYFNKEKALYCYISGVTNLALCDEYDYVAIFDKNDRNTRFWPYYFGKEIGSYSVVMMAVAFDAKGLAAGIQNKSITWTSKNGDSLIQVSAKAFSTTTRLCDEAFPAIDKLTNDRCSVIYGPPKQLERALKKAQADEGKAFMPNLLKDLNRATVVAEHPITLALAFHTIRSKLKQIGGDFVQIKNKFGVEGERASSFSQPPNLHCFIKLPFVLEGDSVQHPWIAEIQFTYGSILKVRHWQHKFYQIDRHEKVKENYFIPVFTDGDN